MKNKIASLLVTLCLALSLSNSAQTQAPVGIIAIGHSGLTGEWSDSNRPGEEAKYNSWATGDAPAVNSIYRRLVAALPAIEGHVANMAVGGASSSTLAHQATLALEAVPTPALVIIQTIDNDIRGDGTDEVHVKEFGANVTAALNVITEASPESRILIVSQRGRPATSLSALAAIPEVVAASGDLFNDDGTIAEDQVAALTAIIELYETEQAQVCAAVPQCATDGGVYTTYVEDLEDLSGDYNHLSIQGNARSADILWPVVKELLGL